MKKFDTSECAKEPIHIPGYTQPDGYLISYNPSESLITGVSTNLFFNLALPTPLSTLFPPSFISYLESLEIQSETNIIKMNLYPLWNHPSIQYDIAWAHAGEERILELFVSSMDSKISSLTPNFMRILEHESIEAMCHQMVLEVEKISGFERVMAYKFDSQFNGCVIAETKKEDLHSYLGLNFPASDIPPQARELYKKQFVRILPDVAYTPIDFSRASNLEALDMSHCYLRSVSPIHIEYLQNMGVGATLTISLIVNDELWGLIACHHRKAQTLSIASIMQAKELGMFFSKVLSRRLLELKENQTLSLMATLETMIQSLQTQSNTNISIKELLYHSLPVFRSLYDANYCFVKFKDAIIHHTKYDQTQLNELFTHLIPKLQNNVFHTDSLKETLPHLSENILQEFSGVLLIKTSYPEQSYWMWMRPEIPLTLSWGGNPEEKGYMNEDGKISPRKSFETYKQTVRFRAQAWEESEISFSSTFRQMIENFLIWFQTHHTAFQQHNTIKKMEDERDLHYSELLSSLVNVIEKRDAYTAGHTDRVAQYCLLIAHAMHLDTQTIELLYEAAMLHDIGKVIVPDAILLKPGRLGKNEYALIQTHLSAGYEILKRITYYKPIAEIVKYHHEKYDGSGYPGGYKSDEIPLSAHIMIVADAIDAMTSNRIYQNKKTIEEALDEILLYRGVWYHPDVVDTAIKVIPTFTLKNTQSQTPLTNIEKARFLYYFQDQLTGVYNQTYLEMIINKKIPEIYYLYFILLETKGMDSYNKKYGWQAGDLRLQHICESIQATIPDERIFRIFGDDFIIGCYSVEEVEEFKKMLSFETGFTIEISVITLEKLIDVLKE